MRIASALLAVVSVTSELGQYLERAHHTSAFGREPFSEAETGLPND